MGWINSELIPPAVLYMHPKGLTIEEIVEVCKDVHFDNWNTTCNPRRGLWDFYLIEEERFKDYQDVASVFLGLKKIRPRKKFPYVRYNFEPKLGRLFIANPNNFRWKRIKNKFYLDLDYLTRDFNEIITHKDGSQLDVSEVYYREQEHDFASMVLTAQAIKLKAWNFLCYNGGKYTQSFLAAFPEALRVYQQEIFNFWLYKTAKRNRWTNNEMMRFRIMNPMKEPDFELQKRLAEEELKPRSYI